MIKVIDLINGSKYLESYEKKRLDMNDIHLVKLFIEEKKKNSINTSKSYENDIKKFFEVDLVEDITIEMLKQVTLNTAKDFINDLTLLGRSSSTINRNISSLTSLYQWIILYENEMYGENIIFNNNPFFNINFKKPAVKHKETEFMNDIELMDLISSLKENTLLELRNKAIVNVAVSTGIGKGQLINLKIKDIVNIHDKSFLIVNKRGYTTQLIELDLNTRELLLKYIKKSNRDIISDKNDYVFKSHGRNMIQSKDKLNPSTINRMFKKLCINANLQKDYKVISLKHSAFMSILSKGINLDKINRIITSRNEVTIGRYINQYKKNKNFIIKK